MSFGMDFTEINWGNVAFKVTGTDIWSYWNVLLVMVPSGVIVLVWESAMGFRYLLFLIVQYLIHSCPTSSLWKTEWKLVGVEYMSAWSNSKFLNKQFINPLLTEIGLMWLYMCDRSMGGDTGTLDELVGSHTRLVIYNTLAICYWRVVIHALLDTRFKGRR